MKIKKLSFVVWLVILCVALSAVYIPVSAADLIETAADSPAAFPGAEGGGMWTTGARGAEKPEIYRVTSLADDGSYGTFRDAVSQPNRVVVFDVSGNIELKRTLTIYNDNLTILGQTAPGDGICIKDYNTYINGNNIILRYLRFRMGTVGGCADDALGGNKSHDLIIDHCSMSWSADECVSFYDVTNFSLQWCIVAESLKNSIHPKGNHGYGAIWGGSNASFHHNLLAHHDSRNPRLAEGDFIGDKDYDMSKQVDLTDLRNNVIYNWGGNSSYGGQGAMAANIVNCYYKPGPATSSSVKQRIYQCSSTGNDIKSKWSTDLYVSGNYMEGSSTVTADNAKGIDVDDNSVQKYIWTDANITDEAKAVHMKYIDSHPVKTDTAQEAYERVLTDAGDNISPDAIDAGIIEDVKNGSASHGSKGLVDTVEQAGGYPILTGTKAKDSDHDGMPNQWEDQNSLNKDDPSDALKVSDSGYMNIELYANALADKSFTRDVTYDADHTDLPEPTAPPAINVTPEPLPETDLVDSWTASSSNKDKAANQTLMPGLTAMFPTTGSKGTQNELINYNWPGQDGKKYNYAITSNNSAGWNNETGMPKEEGTTLKYTAVDDGILFVYAYVLTNKDYYVTKEGCTDYENESIYKQHVSEDKTPILTKTRVKKGETYYIYAAGSKARFQAARFEKYVNSFDILSPQIIGESAEITISKNLDHGKCVLLLATYGEDGIVEDIETTDIAADMSAGTQEIVHVPLTSPDGKTVKAFIWDSSDNLMPLGESKDI